MQENTDWLMFANIAVLKTHLKWRAFTFSLNYKKQVFQASIRNYLFLGKEKNFFFDKKLILSSGCGRFYYLKNCAYKKYENFLAGPREWVTVVGNRPNLTQPAWLNSKKWNLGQKIFWGKFNFFGWARWRVPGWSISHISHYFHQFFHK